MNSLDLSIFFCIGSQKSGTTLLARMLDQHPDIACIWESYSLLPRGDASIFNPNSNNWRRHGFSQSNVERWASIWYKEPQSFLRRVTRRLTGRNYFVTDSFRRTMPEALADFAQRCNATVVGDKWPWYVHFIKQVLGVFPGAKFIYNVRDPRGVWNSGQRFKGRQRGYEILAKMLEKDRIVSPYLTQPNFLTLRYEDLVCQLERTAQQMYDFLGCDFKLEYLHYDRAQDPYPYRWDWIPEASEQFNPWHTRKWREQMPPQAIKQVTERACWFIEKYGVREIV